MRRLREMDAPVAYIQPIKRIRKKLLQRDGEQL